LELITEKTILIGEKILILMSLTKIKVVWI